MSFDDEEDTGPSPGFVWSCFASTRAEAIILFVLVGHQAGYTRYVIILKEYMRDAAEFVEV